MKPNYSRSLIHLCRTLPIISLLLVGNALSAQNCQLLCNTSFEDGVYIGWEWYQLVDDAEVPCWGTTASDQLIEIWGSGMEGITAYDGGQFAELNANMASGLFQDFTATPGQNVEISMAHRGRFGLESMLVEVGHDGVFASVATVVDDIGAWGYHSFTYTLPTGGSNTFTLRFTAIDGGSQGNLLDAISIDLLHIDISATMETCLGASNGEANATVVGAALPYALQWSPIGGSNDIASGLPPGTYACHVTDANGCMDSATVTITAGQTPELTVTATAMVSCPNSANGEATAVVNGGMSPYAFQWSPMGGTNGVADALPAGTYDLTVTDANGCMDTASVVITAGTGPDLALSATQMASCTGSANGEATAVVNGGAMPYAFQWSPIGGTSDVANALIAGTYDCTVTDANGCTDTASVIITEGQTPVLSLTATAMASCSGSSNGEATAVVNGGAFPYAFQWSPNGGTNDVAVSLTAGTYDCTVTDANGCTDVASVIITEGIGLDITMHSSPVLCPGGSDGTAEVEVNNGTAPYGYAWSLNVGANAQAVGLSANTYACTVTDASGCTATDSVVVTSPSPLMVSTSNLSVCAGSDVQLDAQASGGTSGYDFQWTPEAPTTSPETNTLYSVVATDANGCVSSTATALITVFAALTVSITAPPADECAPLCVPLSVSEGTGASIAWSFGDGAEDAGADVSHCYPHDGTFEVVATLTDANGCAATERVQLCVREEVGIFMPNAFTPNGDGFNDAFGPVIGGHEPKEFNLSIFDRWGALIFETSEPTASWNGNNTPDGTYVWSIHYSFTGQVAAESKGSVTLLR